MGFLCGKVRLAVCFEGRLQETRIFLVVLCVWCDLRRSCRLGYVQFALAVVGVDDSNGGDEEVISTWQVRSSG
jgi:hypothetical protein